MLSLKKEKTEYSGVLALCLECHELIDLEGAHVVIDDDVFLHVRCFSEGGYMYDDDIVGKGFCNAIESKN